MKNQFIQILESKIPNFRTAKFLLAVSGGIDSCVMTHLFHFHHLNFDIAHCNFQLRGEDSDQDMHFVETELITFLLKNDINKPKVFTKTFDTRTIQKNSGNSIEMVARDLRYEWFKEFKPDYDFICTAHHANDNAETLLINLTRGTGYKGLNGISLVNEPFFRPLLLFTSKQILQYAQENKIPYRVDLSNLTNEYHRNKIRNQVIPILEGMNPNLIHTFQKNIHLFSKQYQFYLEQIQKVKKRILIQEKNFYRIQIDSIFKEQNPEIVLFEILNEFHFNFSTAQQIYDQLKGESGKIFYSESHLLVKDRSIIFIYSKKDLKPFDSITIAEPEEFEKVGINARISNNNSDYNFEKNPDIAYLDADRIPFPLIIRSWKEGDYFYPFGMKGKKKLSDLFVDYKLNLIQKQQVKLLCDQKEPDKIIWIIGLRTSDLFKINDQTKQILVLKNKQSDFSFKNI